MIQPANTLSAEIDIAAQATVIRKGENGIITDEDTLINCSQYGNQFRHSDPHVKALISQWRARTEADMIQIGSEINKLARDGYKISIADPVAIYISSFDEKAFKLNKQDESQDLVELPRGTIRYERGSKGSYVRIRIQVPDGVTGTQGQQLTVSDIVDTSNGQNIEYGAQFADHVTMCVRGVVAPPPRQAADPKPCRGVVASRAAPSCSSR